MNEVEERKKKFSDAQSRYKERVGVATWTVDSSKARDSRVVVRPGRVVPAVGSLPLDVTSGALLTKAEEALQAAKDLVQVSIALVAESKKK